MSKGATLRLVGGILSAIIGCFIGVVVSWIAAVILCHLNHSSLCIGEFGPIVLYVLFATPIGAIIGIGAGIGLFLRRRIKNM